MTVRAGRSPRTAASVVLAAAAVLTSCGTTTPGTSAEPAPTERTPSTRSPAPLPADRPSATGSRPPPVDADLLAAAYANDLPRAEASIRAGADVNTQDASQQSAFLIATSEVGDDPRLLELTLAAGAEATAKDSYNGTGLIRAAERGYPRIVARLLTAGVEVDHVNRLGWTALLEAVILGDGGPRHTETVRLLVAGGADVNLPDPGGVTPLTHAQRRGQQGVADLLQAAGART